MSNDPYQRLAERGIKLPPVAAPQAAYVPAVRSGSHVYVSGQIPVVDGAIVATGKVGAQITAERARELAEICALNVLAAVESLVGLSAVVRVVKVVGFVASAPGFTGQPEVINGASEFLADIFGEIGQHARSAVGVAELPRGVPVEVEAIIEVS